MDREQVRAWENKCIEEQPPACTTICPIHVDARGMMERVCKGDFAGGFSILARFVPFPGIIGKTCDHPCESACKRAEAGDAVRIGALERACVDYGYKPTAVATFPVRKRAERVAVVGGGLSGLTVAVDLAVKGYIVVVFESKKQLLGRIREFDEQVIAPGLIDADLAVLNHGGIEIRYGTTVGNGGEGPTLQSLTEEFNAVYLGLGPQPVGLLALGMALQADGRIAIDPVTLATSHPKVFAGGSQRYSPAAFSPITSVQDGRCAGLSIDRLMQGASLSARRETEGPYPTRLFTNTRRFAPLPAVAAAEPLRGYTQDEAKREAERCFPCHCLECVKLCEYLDHYGSYPKRYVRQIYNNDSIILGNRPLNRMINSCALCGQCEAACPEKLSMGEVCLDARHSMVKAGKMPRSIHEFALQDMAFSTGELFALARPQPGFTSSQTMFYPGCQLGASSPEHVFRMYEHLRQKVEGGVGLMLGCCGAPAKWAGQEELFRQTLEAFTAEWKAMGSPRVITACSSCYRMFKDNLPEMAVESLWTLLERIGLPLRPRPVEGGVLAIHDPCGNRHDADIQDSVRRLMGQLGVGTVELDSHHDLTSCCGYGGLMWFCNAELADKVVNRRIGERAEDYVTYCAMCRDNFSAKGKRALHILDLICGDDHCDPAARLRPTYSQRRENRVGLKNRLLREVWGETVSDAEKAIELRLSPEVSEVMEKRKILADDVRQVIQHAESTGEKIEDKGKGWWIASYRPATVTFWVQYAKQGDGFVVHNVYCHRMEVKASQ